MKKILTNSLLAFIVLLSHESTFGQCTNGAAFGTVAAPSNTTPLTISTCTYQSEYNTVTAVPAATSFTSTNSAGGCITVHSGTPGGPVVGFGSSPLNWTSTVAGTYYIHYTTNCACATASGTCTTTTITCTSCGGGGGSDPCSTPGTLSCGVPVVANMNGIGAGWNVTNCGYSTPGDELVYSFTATISGIYSLNISAQSGGYVDFFWAAASGGCSSGAAWNCIDDVFSPGTYGAMNWVAGTTYYILLDPEGTGAYSSTFSINCPSGGPDPCASITPLIGCGTSTLASMSGSGAGWNIGSCGFSTPGTEMIFSFTATASGVHSIDITSALGGFVDFFWADAAGGCSAGAFWNCISSVGFVGNYGSMNWIAGNTYYILIDPEGTGAYSVEFNVDCPNPGTPAIAGDCNIAIPVCTNLGFQVDPSGFGLSNELCTGCISNPSTNVGNPANSGCLQSGELNSTWFTVNVAAGGTLEFSFGTPGGIVGNCFDWIMWPYNPTACASISNNTLAPISCNWNLPCNGFTGMATATPAGGSSGNFQPTLNVTTGQQYVICFSNYSSAVTSVPLNFFGTADISCTVLPVEITTFSGENMGGYNTINWTTAAEVNNALFVVEHSADGVNFTPCAELPGAGTDLDGADYRTQDFNPFPELTYYRLKQVDANGAYKYSNTIVIPSGVSEIFQIVSAYPNPVSETLHVDIISPKKDEVTLSVVDFTGKTIYHSAVSLEEGLSVVSLPVDQLMSGVYMLSLTSGGSGAQDLIRFTVK